MKRVTTRDLRNHGGDVLDRVLAGEVITVTRSGVPVAELAPVRRKGPDRIALLERWRKLPPVDPDSLRGDVDALLDPAL